MNDFLILKELKKINNELSILVASYDKGYTYFLGNGFRPFNLGLKQDEELSLKAGFRIWSIIRKFKPDLVVSDEVFIALHITKGLKIPSVLITHWFFETLSENHPMIPAVKKADHVIFVDTAQFHNIPMYYNVHLTFVGPVLREFEYNLRDKEKAKKELGISDENRVILVTPGGRHSDRSKLLDVSIEAFKELKEKNVKLILLTGELYDKYFNELSEDNNIIVKDFDWKMDRLMVASDLVICKGTFSTTWELAFLGIPSISIPDINNPIDQIHVNRMNKHNLTLRIDPRRLNKLNLLKNIEKIIDTEGLPRRILKKTDRLVEGRGQKEAAEEISYFINRIPK
jgi:uncharacterized protein (TIGR00661 family)